jgi:hypothetical protein
MSKPGHLNALSAVRSRLLPVILASLLLIVPGLTQGEQAASNDISVGQNTADKTDPTAELSKLQAVMFSYADKYMSAIAQVTLEAQRKDPTNPELRLRMHSLKLLVTASVQELAVSTNPESTLLDMMVYATLQVPTLFPTKSR